MTDRPSIFGHDNQVDGAQAEPDYGDGESWDVQSIMTSAYGGDARS